MPTPRKKLPQHLVWAVEELEHHQERVTRLLSEIDGVMSDRRGINKWALEALHAKLAESAAEMGRALDSIERRDPPPDGNGASPAIDRAWLEAMAKLTVHDGNGTLEIIRAFVEAKLKELEA